MARILLDKIPLFNGLSKKEIALVGNFLIEEKYQEGDRIIKEGKERARLLIITEGQVVLKANIGGQVEIAFFKENDFLGEMAIAQDEGKHSYSADAASGIVHTLELSVYNWHKIEKENPDIVRKLYKNIIATVHERLHHANNKLATLFVTGKIMGAFDSVEKIADYILEAVLEMVPANKALFLTYDDSAGKASVQRSIGYDNLKNGQSIKVSNDPILKAIAETPETVIFNRDDFPSAFKDIPYSSKSIIITPVSIQNKVYGFIILGDKTNKRNFSRNNEILLEAIANQVLPAIQDLEKTNFEKAEQDIKRANIDPFEGLK